MRFKYLIILIVICIGFNSASGQDRIPASINVAQLRQHLTFIASDSLQGRSFTTDVPGLEITAKYIRENAKQIGLKPAVKNYFQKFNIISVKSVKNGTTLSVLKRNGKKVYSTKSVVCLNPQNKTEELEGEIIFAGYGLRDETSGDKLFNDMDVNGKIVLYFAGRPEIATNKEYGWNNELERGKTKWFFEQGASGIVVVTNPKDSGNFTFNRIKNWSAGSLYSVSEIGTEVNEPVFVTTPETAAELMGGNKCMNEVVTALTANEMPCVIQSDKYRVKIRAGYKTESFESQNVIGYLEGSDIELKDECVVYMAHYDHLGTDKNNEVYNGADDNGSGTVALLGIANAFSNLKVKPKRSIVFLWTTGEEVGMLGSGYYSQHPVFPIEKTAVCINLDMVGRVYNPEDSVWKNSPKKVKDFDGIYTLMNNFSPKLEHVTDSMCSLMKLVPDKSLPKHFFRTSDHYHFHRLGVPILNLATGYHADYHKISDTVPKINFEKLRRVAGLAYWIGYEMAATENDVNRKTDVRNVTLKKVPMQEK